MLQICQIIKFLLPFSVLAMLLLTAVKADQAHGILERNLKDEFSFSSFRNEAKHKYYMNEKLKHKQESIKKLDQMKKLQFIAKLEKDKEERMKNIFNKVKQSIMTDIF